MTGRALVCGGRKLADRRLVFGALYALVSETGELIRAIIQGGADGADALGRQWGELCGIPVETYLADWARDGRAAGPIRNQRMLDEGKPDIVMAFPGGRGTADMVRRARKAGVEVREIASVDERPEGQDPKGLGAQHASAVGAAETPAPSPIDPLNVQEGL